MNNPFFQQMKAVSIADVLRVVDRDTGFIDDFQHVLGLSSKSRQYEVDLLAILIANATNQTSMASRRFLTAPMNNSALSKRTTFGWKP